MMTVKILKTLLVNAASNALITEKGIDKVLKAYTGGEILNACMRNCLGLLPDFPTLKSLKIVF